ncbi:A-kinase anchor protein 1, mitochondrial [Eumeta japonica]|uniref:A-kinase anchor protein 1, mitochondrial n=1 Tax=Eumeta variegata TaxID=151549 RepID=A0A4C1YPD4_EUMVA|nr:A-kinase anchor protein 1, mitochondrial [Eumeta japonica]
MAPCRQLLMWSVPSIAVLLGIFWFKKKREYAKSDPRGRERIKTLQEELAEALKAEAEAARAAPTGRVECAIIKSSPIDIVPNGGCSQRSSPLQMTDEEVDLEIEKIIRKKSVEQEKNFSMLIDKTIVAAMGSCTDNSELVAAGTPHRPVLLNNSVCDTPDGLRSSDKSNFEESAPQIVETIDTDRNSSIKEDLTQRDRTDMVTVTLKVEPTVESAAAESEEIHNNIVNECSNNSVHENSKFPAQQSRHISERDSANHSPVEAMLASPSMCHFSDDHSEGSSDSGKGCSEAASPPPANLNILPSDGGLRIHQFVIPQTLVGLLIGKHGSFVTQIKGKTGASVFVRRHPDSSKLKICAVEGTQTEIEAALEMIRDKFPEKRFPTLSLQEISAELYQRLLPLVPEFLQLQLVESVNNETIMTCLVSAGHFFLQQPLHPTFPSLHALHRLMAATYQNPEVPPLPKPVKEGSICAAPTENNWYRAQVISTSEEHDTSVVKLVDFGGYLTVDNDQLKQIRSDFMTLPFQATEALLAFVKPPNNESEWGGEALRIMAGLTAGQLLHAQVAGYDEAGLPLVHLYLTIGAQQVIFLNRELVERGLAEWDAPAES